MTSPAASALTELSPQLFATLEAYAERLDIPRIDRALRYAAGAHRGQKRMSGEDFVEHSIAVASILAGLLVDTASICAALLHDVVEDSDVSTGDIATEFGDEVAGLVDGLTKISHLTFRSSVEEQSENYRKLLLSVAKDARVIIIKLADRLHNMRTLEHLSDERRRRIATETREIYAPLAHRFGMAQVKAELEDLAFKFLEPEDYTVLAKQVASKRAQRQEAIARLRGPLEEELTRAGVGEFEVSGRPKHLWSIYQKMKKRDKPFDEIYDLMAMRVIVASVPECYHVLGIIHHVWTPLQERIKDYIASPKSNGYQSLHTTIFGPQGQLFEIQIRTREMHRTAEYGIAAHWLYKTASEAETDDLGRQLGWFRQLLELQQESASPEEFLEFLKVDLYHDEIFVFTPQGDVKQLPKGATAIDFAFHVHTDVGFRTTGARVNGRIAPLHRELRNGDTVEVLTSNQARPSRDWLAHVRTGRARSKIKQWIRQEEEAVSQQLGQEILTRELKRRRLELPEADQVTAAARTLNLGDRAALEISLGRGDLAIGQVMRALFPDVPADALQEKPPTMFGRVVNRFRLGRGIRIQGADGLMVRYAQCCQPVPGDPVVGYVTQGRGISIHRADCPNLLTLTDLERRVEIDWQEQTGESYAVRLAVTGEDRRGLYADVMQAISATGTNVRGADLQSKDGTMFGTIFVEVDNLPHLAKVLKAIRRVKGVGTVERREAQGP
ncbi:MAG: bifunctional (p)ppGpp synthetase/guanosine-3',5'-bis(diphosphate) 3'-pyrophosphohydrolase [Gemmatimonadetes bacterium]|nr:bifunctional (p)ppGpp synthetase/guanosine-3',5'-bis(diphosphate) 3'-pyrophosphohydrolase [Gemmatimonadota bacterium]MCA9767685.1 bifunctional (p)ppGpp synthetase/guanosine-3',5'-bis(diphosphate) 3'-pyrophosphohydrolase [Gemmatimonadota bacterium]MCB9505644.1 bifunctional (p)ppGpp synthetase/guanosine-3',5'-bis(diphosphate) 3'-pyrophosphohydrolase [Gemmatimonadales bacterium]MCB9517320.1 bifunctional (p)ppGpp synthetase/guanosine-3',5'-bis(diphosphate) 3'-pyrophosphohydrolase [Gemmatimonadale